MILSEWIWKHTKGAETVVDFGSMFFDKLACVHGDVKKKIGIEIHKPYIDKATYHDCEKIYGDMRLFEKFIQEDEMDCAMFIDTLEHLEKQDAVWLMAKVKDKFRKVMLMIPEGNHPQNRDCHKMGADEHQTHRSTWTKKDIEEMGFQIIEIDHKFHKNEEGKDSGCIFAVWHKVSIIINTFNRTDLLKLNLDSLRCRNARSEYEIIVVDDGMKEDGVEELCKKYELSMDIKYIFTGFRNKNKHIWRTPSIAKNIGIKHSKGDVLIFSCSDLYHFNDTTPKLVWATLYYHNDFNVPAQGIDDDGRILKYLQENKTDHIPEELKQGHAPLNIGLGFFAGVMRHKVFQIRGFDERFSVTGDKGWEDVDFVHRLMNTGCKIRRIEGIDIAHLYHSRSEAHGHLEEEENKAISDHNYLSKATDVNTGGWGELDVRSIEDKVTVVITSHMEDFTSIEGLEYVIVKFFERTGLNECKFIINFDRHNNDPRTRDYLHNIKTMKLVDGKLLVHDKSYFAGAFLEFINHIETPYMFLLEHDWEFLESVNMGRLVHLMDRNENVNHIRFNKRKTVSVGMDAILEDCNIDGVDLVKTSAWSNNPYLGRTSRIKEWSKHVHVKGGYTLAEGEIHAVYDAEVKKEGFAAVHPRWGTYIYGKIGDEARIKHLGRHRFSELKNENFINCKKICFCPPECGCCQLHSFISSYDKILEALNPERILEWGPGKNTEIALQRGCHIEAIEQTKKYVEAFKDHPKFQYSIIPINDDRYLNKDNLSLYKLFFVDSRRRAECMEAISECKHDFIACLHDAQRQRYWRSLRKFRHVVFLDDGFCAVTNSDEYFNILKVISGIQ